MPSPADYQPRKRGRPAANEVIGEANDRAHFLNMFKKLIETFSDVIRARFDDKNLENIMLIHKLITYKTVDNLDLLKDLNSKLSIYSKVIDLNALENELELFYCFKLNNHTINWSNISELCSFFVLNKLHQFFPNVFSLIKLYLSIPVSSATAERSFSCLRRLKNWLRNSIGQEQLSSLALINLECVENSIINLNIDSIIDEFASSSARRLQLN